MKYSALIQNRKSVREFTDKQIPSPLLAQISEYYLTSVKRLVPDLETELKKEMADAESLVLDFSKLDYISSAGLRVLLSAHKTMAPKGGMKVTNVNEIVREVFEVTGFADILTIE